jgi:signal transduction histidine kinase
VFAIFKESVNNAVKYAECSTLKTDFVVTGESLSLTVSDDGKGFDTAFVLSDEFKPEMGGNGVASIKRRTVELGGVCEIKSTLGLGTTIHVAVPLVVRTNGER